ncbi:MAG: sterol desaturase family protein [Ignavibacteriae bacterium]|nr:sterol desaturase family protein [Ignavibacteriota bacterium]
MITQVFGFTKDLLVPSLGILGIITLANSYLPHVYSVPITISTFVLCLFLMDFLYYLYHVISHKFLLFWTFHFVHHSDTKFNLSVGFRSSWFEMIGLFTMYSLLLIAGFPLVLFVTVFSITSTYQFLTHARYFRAPEWFTYLFVTQQYHLVHHGIEMKDQNSNFGGVFTLWDRLFGTYSTNKNVKVFGIEGYSQNNFIKIQTDPMVTYCKKLFKVAK